MEYYRQKMEEVGLITEHQKKELERVFEDMMQALYADRNKDFMVKRGPENIDLRGIIEDLCSEARFFVEGVQVKQDYTAAQEENIEKLLEALGQTTSVEREEAFRRFKEGT